MQSPTGRSTASDTLWRDGSWHMTSALRDDGFVTVDSSYHLAGAAPGQRV